MSLPVHLVPTLDGAREGDVVEVTGDEAHHAVAVRRLAVGERVVLTDGAGTSAVGEIAATGKRSMEVRIASLTHETPASPRVTVVQALPKGERGELAVEVLTEIGVATIVPWAASRSVAVWRGERADRSLARWRATAREAAKQSRRAWFPRVEPLATTHDVCALVGGADLAVVLHEDAVTPLASVTVPARGSVAVVVGPEGGLTGDEVAAFTASGADAVHLGAEVLRTSTAGVVAVAALLARTPRWAGTT
jgi:16S rRNA (uracil1498-N3)-methyltransferase